MCEKHFTYRHLFLRNTSSSTTFSSQRRPSQSGSRNSWRDHEESARSTESGTRNGPHGRSYQTHPLEFGNVKKMAETSVDLAVIVRKLTEEEHGLKKLLRDNHGNWDLIELVLVVLGSFCERNGPASFPQGFIQMVNILAEGEVFREIPSIILQLPRSRANNLGTPQDRLKRLVHSVSSFITEMLVLAPAFACNCLGQDFFEDLMSLKDVPSIRALNRTDVFQCFQEVNTLHKVKARQFLDYLNIVFYGMPYSLISESLGAALESGIEERGIQEKVEFQSLHAGSDVIIGPPG